MIECQYSRELEVAFFHTYEGPIFSGWLTTHLLSTNIVGWWRWALLSPDGVVPSRMVGVSASVSLPLHRKIQKFSSGTGSPRWSGIKGHKTVMVVVVVTLCI